MDKQSSKTILQNAAQNGIGQKPISELIKAIKIILNESLKQPG